MKKRNIGKYLLGQILILLLAIASVGTAFAYWGGSILAPNEKNNSGEVVIGDGEEIQTIIESTDIIGVGKLVPKGFAKNDQVEFIELEFDVLWSGKGAEGALGSLDVSFNTGHKLIKGELSFVKDVTAGTSTKVVLRVTLNEPANIDEYNEVANKSFVVVVTFTVVPK